MSDVEQAVTSQGRAAPLGQEPAHGYRAYGLTIRSDIPLPELEPDAARRPDLVIRLRPTGRGPVEDLPQIVFELGEDPQYLAWPRLCAFLIKDAAVIDVEPGPDISEELLHFPLLGPVMAFLLHLRGMLVLHASAVAVGERSAVFVGDKRAGKSTTAAAMVAAGHRLLTDDVLAIEFPPGGAPRIAPGFPQLKLAEDAEQAIGVEGAVALPLVRPNFEKRQHRLTRQFSHATAPPSRIYVLERGERAAVTPLRPDQALAALMRFSYVTRFGDKALSGPAASEHLKRCADVVGVTSVCRLETPTGLDRIGELVELVERDLA